MATRSSLTLGALRSGGDRDYIMKELFGGAIGVALLVGCASPPNPEFVSADGAPVECRYEIVTGSNRKEKICATVADWDEANEIRRQQAEDQVQRANRRATDTFRAIEADAGGVN